MEGAAGTAAAVVGGGGGEGSVEVGKTVVGRVEAAARGPCSHRTTSATSPATIPRHNPGPHLGLGFGLISHLHTTRSNHSP